MIIVGYCGAFDGWHMGDTQFDSVNGGDTNFLSMTV
eukprot:CAMPEP_0202460308 /NCGR_PEP_ID=MMETSP1360-20130828/43042_1 /ASSEMBLY_ACC=CAM_ASM_000848 /TAXON_ID=515479 /ORGANISM="Licmophora paradoxa, Strain CCMP2313" /LENGTH=35 /DNA_ID= /DNA_START= /DNA_END= /DNA_ORIENTATION=